MSANESGVASNGTGPAFSERELQLLGWAMQSLKSGPPEIDYEKLAVFAGMSNPRSASNAWAKIKNKLMAPSSGTPPTTPKKAGGRKKAVSTNGENGEALPVKPARKRAAKKQDVNGEASPPKKARGKKEDVNGEALPKKKVARGKNEIPDENSAPPDEDSAQDVFSDDSTTKNEPVKAGDEPSDEVPIKTELTEEDGVADEV